MLPSLICSSMLLSLSLHDQEFLANIIFILFEKPPCHIAFETGGLTGSRIAVVGGFLSLNTQCLMTLFCLNMSCC